MGNPAEPEHLAAIEVSRHTPSELDVTLAAAIPRRRTDRRLYNGWCVPDADIALMGARAARAGVMLRQVELLPKLQSMWPKLSGSMQQITTILPSYRHGADGTHRWQVFLLAAHRSPIRLR